MRIYYGTKYRDFLAALVALRPGVEVLEECFEKLKPRSVKKGLNYDLYLVSFGKLTKLQAIDTGEAFLTDTFTLMLGPEEREYPHFNWVRQRIDWLKLCVLRRKVSRLKTADALRFILKVKEDIEFIIKAFDGIKYKPTPDEIKAGIKNNSGSLHTVADWYARRMGIQDVEEVYRLPWTRVYSAMKIDVEDLNYRKRYSKIVESKNKQN